MLPVPVGVERAFPSKDNHEVEITKKATLEMTFLVIKPNSI